MWDKLTVGQFITLYDIDANTNLNEIEKQQKMLSIIEGKKEEDYDNIKYRELLRIYAEKLAFFSDMPETKPVDFIEVNGNRYKFNFEISEITAGQYIDINTFGGDIVSLNKIAACFFLPMKGKRYMEYGAIPHDKVAEDLLDANFLQVYSCMVFFYQLFKELISDIITSSEITEELKQNLIRLWKDGVGFSPLSKSQILKT
jgi:hypothetical protein